ncbi:hypothetical protein V492_02657 [Pseudogymnoascus sp. VKM F-4246]|nr:hypothetical protein V492_02657 [Pseudogymnoascus sp. VKM F-4246]
MFGKSSKKPGQSFKKPEDDDAIEIVKYISIDDTPSYDPSYPGRAVPGSQPTAATAVGTTGDLWVAPDSWEVEPPRANRGATFLPALPLIPSQPGPPTPPPISPVTPVTPPTATAASASDPPRTPPQAHRGLDASIIAAVAAAVSAAAIHVLNRHASDQDAAEASDAAADAAADAAIAASSDPALAEIMSREAAREYHIGHTLRMLEGRPEPTNNEPPVPAEDLHELAGDFPVLPDEPTVLDDEPPVLADETPARLPSSETVVSEQPAIHAPMEVMLVEEPHWSDAYDKSCCCCCCKFRIGN